MGDYTRSLRVPFSRDLWVFLGHIANKPDDYTVGQLNAEINKIIKPEGMEYNEYETYLTWWKDRTAVDESMTMKEIRAQPKHTFQFRMFLRLSLSIDPFDPHGI